MRNSKVQVRHGVPEFVCPKCGHNDMFQLLVPKVVVLSVHQDSIVHEFEDGLMIASHTTCACNKCGHKATVYDFLPELQEKAAEEQPDVTTDKSTFFVEGVEGQA